MSRATAVRASRLVRSYGFFRALDSIDLEVSGGEIVLLIGPNGAGKTTLLRVLAGLLPATEGSYSLLGLAPREEGERIRRKIGFLSHSLALYADLTPLENLRFFARLYRLEKAEGRIEHLLQDVGLERWRDDPVRVFSRGMKQRLALARAFLHEPEVLLLDEPFTGLDSSSASILAARLREKRDEGRAILLASHRFDMTAPLGDAAIVLQQGKVKERVDLSSIEPSDRAAHLMTFLEAQR